MKKQLILSALFLVGCGSGGGSDPIKVSDTSTEKKPNSVITQSALLSPGSACQNGGISIDIGLDANANGKLDPAEVSETQTVCNGDTGYTTLINIVDEAAGAHCENGGKAIQYGKDTNRNDILDATELDNTAYVCNGLAGGVPGKDGADGADNKAVKSIYCNGGLAGEAAIGVAYDVKLLSSGDLIASATVTGPLFEVSKTNYYSSQQVGATKAGVSLTFDLVGPANYGWWNIELNRATLVTTITYDDIDYNGGVPYSWTWKPAQCIVNSYL